MHFVIQLNYVLCEFLEIKITIDFAYTMLYYFRRGVCGKYFTVNEMLLFSAMLCCYMRCSCERYIFGLFSGLYSSAYIYIYIYFDFNQIKHRNILKRQLINFFFVFEFCPLFHDIFMQRERRVRFDTC